MILRRLAHNLREQNWTAIAIEFVLLVLGVFLGFQAQQWASERAERQLGHVHLARILNDLCISSETNELNLSRLSGFGRNQFRAVDSLRKRSLPEPQRMPSPTASPILARSVPFDGGFMPLMGSARG